MKICPRCYKELSTERILTIHKCTPKVTNCCGYDRAVVVAGRYTYDPEFDAEFKVQRGKTYHYACRKCGEACDLINGEITK